MSFVRTIRRAVLLVAMAVGVVLSIASLGAGEPGGADGQFTTTLQLTNMNSESIFTGWYSINGGEQQSWLSGERLDMFEHAERQLDTDPNALISLHFKVTYWGEESTYDFEDIELNQDYGTLELTYDWDSATATNTLIYDYD